MKDFMTGPDDQDEKLFFPYADNSTLDVRTDGNALIFAEIILVPFAHGSTQLPTEILQKVSRVKISCTLCGYNIWKSVLSAYIKMCKHRKIDVTLFIQDTEHPV